MHEKLTRWWSGVSLRTKITGVTVLLVTLGLLVAGVGTMTVLRTYLLADADAKMTKYAQAVPGYTKTGAKTCDALPGINDYYLAVLDTNGDELCNNGALTHSAPNVPSMPFNTVIKTGGVPFTVWDKEHDDQWRIVAVPRNIVDSADYVTVVVAVDLVSSDKLINQFLVIFLGFGLAVIVLGAALTRLLVTSTFTPLREVEATAAAIADGDFSQRLQGATPNTEVGRLNRSLNTMLNRIDRAFSDRARTIDQMRRFVGDASHELRTPLVSVRGYAELYRMGALQKPEDVAQAMERIEKEAIRMGELVSDLLELARIDEAKPLQLGAVDLVPIAHDAALDAMASAPKRTVSVIVAEALPSTTDAPSVPVSPAPPTGAPAATGPIRFAGAQLARLRRRQARGELTTMPIEIVAPVVDAVEQPAVVLAEENKIRQVVTNLMGNAMRFTPDDSPLEIVVSVDSARGVGVLEVVDHGEGIPPQIREKIFQRFWRADSSRTRETGGSGLGLAIVSGIIASHKGEVTVRETPGGGATFRVSLPLLPEGYTPAVAPKRD
ncbi:HAMP domain-containing histidine kinase [Glaciihabitans sp. INWT7]|uniref:sensor histidine kinase n=1 Tax=Glaciihabitans sp. INWT7 TaxID=2596912 RepID=UPI00162366D6|nr:HAMP domain-containing sensor histidine kinase [Glaciihabitans sp. INWT7]QNE47786.1 HAMP domain-containing histidine kinase [Glaciihabitans sp. INWT7]